MQRSRIIAAVVVLSSLSGTAQVPGTSANPSAQQPAPKVVAGSLISRPPLETPDIELFRHGTRVVVHVTITKTGEVTDIQYIKGNRELMPAVLKNLKTWKYKPYLYEGQPVEVESLVDIGFEFF